MMADIINRITQDRREITLEGALLLHRGHSLTPTTNYRSPKGKVYGSPFLTIRCETCKRDMWDASLYADKAPLPLD